VPWQSRYAARVSPRPIFLLGMMGAGKSTVGRELAHLLGAEFIELDARIELLFGAAIAELFEHGEDYFRACERTALRSLVDEPGFSAAAAVVATGGGIVTLPQNVVTMAEHGRLFYLAADIGTLCARLSTPEELRRRPLLTRGEEEGAALGERLTQLLAAREAAYRGAGVVVDARGTPGEVATRLHELMQLGPR
jgi:shikimate kinase